MECVNACKLRHQELKSKIDVLQEKGRRLSQDAQTNKDKVHFLSLSIFIITYFSRHTIYFLQHTRCDDLKCKSLEKAMDAIHKNISHINAKMAKITQSSCNGLEGTVVTYEKKTGELQRMEKDMEGLSFKIARMRALNEQVCISIELIAFSFSSRFPNTLFFTNKQTNNKQLVLQMQELQQDRDEWQERLSRAEIRKCKAFSQSADEQNVNLEKEIHTLRAYLGKLNKTQHALRKDMRLAILKNEDLVLRKHLHLKKQWNMKKRPSRRSEVKLDDSIDNNEIILAS